MQKFRDAIEQLSALKVKLHFRQEQAQELQKSQSTAKTSVG